MLSIKARILIVAGLLLLLAVIINMVRKRRLELKYVLAWLLADLALIFFTIFPQTMMGLAQLLGIYSPVNMIFFLGFVFLAMIIFSLTVALSHATANQRRLAQSAALREYEEYTRSCSGEKTDQHNVNNGGTDYGSS
ncbi:MAG: DUF2304 domain-containing protein [Lachnospiraceae bacterium]|nr:DUF2304 domain-containing protein [Lachnospiraceae bacterium]